MRLGRLHAFRWHQPDTIAPVDFEKFVLKGVVPETVPPDVYRGVVVVRSDKDLFIPVVLVVTPP